MSLFGSSSVLRIMSSVRTLLFGMLAAPRLAKSVVVPIPIMSSGPSSSPLNLARNTAATETTTAVPDMLTLAPTGITKRTMRGSSSSISSSTSMVSGMETALEAERTAFSMGDVVSLRKRRRLRRVTAAYRAGRKTRPYSSRQASAVNTYSRMAGNTLPVSRT
uniref:Putative secreted protein n=1 Tax=Ixodes ricinus TaxID=34613 RepID=A0A6B0UXU1_IXORI